jgi:exosortase
VESRKRHIYFLVSILASLLVFHSPIKQVIVLSFRDPLYSHIPLIPLLSGFFLFVRRRSIFHHIGYSPISGTAFIGIGGLFYIAGLLRLINLNENDYLSLLTFSAVMVWTGTFILFYGFGTARRAAFPLLLLFCMAPVPSFLIQAFVKLLQDGSAETVSAIFHVLGLQVTRDGYTFHFPQLSVEIWEECAGIRAGIAFVITSIIAANLLLRKAWTKTLAVLLSVPIAILRNSVRIVSLSVIGAYVDERIFHSDLHDIGGGILFFILALFLLWVVIALLRKFENSA